MNSIIEKIHPVHCGNSSFVAANEDIFNGSPTTDVINLKNAQGVMFVVACNANVGSGAATITIEACDNVTPSNTTAIVFRYQLISTTDLPGTLTAATTSGVASIGTTNTMLLVEVDAATVGAASVNSTYNNTFVRLKATETQSDAVDGAILAFLFGLRYSPLTTTQIS
uniref:Uncharacterized protein n=1 Tax=viral metagenome TaxID=1070528 RepID=A0A6M3IRI5_9ZZZZ